FARAEIHHWIETQLPAYSDEQLKNLEGSQGPRHEHELLVARLLNEPCMAVPFQASTKASVLKELVRLAEQSWQVYDPRSVLAALEQREQIATTALDCGVAIPHPRRPMPQFLGESVMAFGRTASGIPFGAPQGGLTDLFFL